MKCGTATKLLQNGKKSKYSHYSFVIDGLQSSLRVIYIKNVAYPQAQCDFILFVV